MWSMPPSSSFCPLLYLYGGCLSSRGHWCSWLGCKVFPAISAIPVLELATNSGSIQCQPGNVQMLSFLADLIAFFENYSLAFALVGF